jgi:hypothetical protein
MPRFPRQAKQCVRLGIKPNLVDTYIQKRFDSTLRLSLHIESFNPLSCSLPDLDPYQLLTPVF